MTEELKPLLELHPTTSTLPVLQDDCQSLADNSSRSGSESGSHHDLDKAPPLDHLPTISRPSIRDILLLFGIIAMLSWPWIFFGVVWAKKGLQMDNRIAKVVRNNPHATTYIITLICSIVSMIVTTFFSFAIVRFAQELVTRYQPTRPFHLKVLLALRYQIWPWGTSWKDVRNLMTENRWQPTLLLIICILICPNLVSTTASLITPIPFYRTASVSGTEIDFSSTDPTCLDWFKANPLPPDCDWISYNGQLFSNCLGAYQMLDVLEAGRGNMLEFVTNKSQSLTFNQLGGDDLDGIHFLGPIRGVRPIGPSGFSALNPPLLSDPEIVAGMISYNYTLNSQGLNSRVRCSYQLTTPIQWGALSNYTVAYNVPSCRAIGAAGILTGVPMFSAVLGRNTLMYWACQSAPNNTQTPSYSIYLAGVRPEFRDGYKHSFGNITCTVYPIRPAIFPVTYQSSGRAFSAGTVLPANEPAASSLSPFYLLVNRTLIGLGEIISHGQNSDSNLVAEMVMNLGIKSFKLAPFERSDKYLRLFEQMIRGILEYEITYIRLIYSMTPDPPSSCIRTVTGSVNYQVLGWFVTKANIGFLIPMTMINAAGLVALLLAVAFARQGGYPDPHHPRCVNYDPYSNEEMPDEWRQRVTLQPTNVLKKKIDVVKCSVKQGGKELTQTYAVLVANGPGHTEEMAPGMKVG